MSRPAYVLVTPVRNEAHVIEFALKSMAKQTIPPERWVIVSDGSTDRTDDVVREHAPTLPFLRFVRRESTQNRDFSSKVFAIREGMKHLEGVAYDFIGNLDGDVSLTEGYFELLLSRFAADPQLGVAGGAIHEARGRIWHAHVAHDDRSVAGAVQLFRRECYEQIGGYLPLPRGGEDAVAEAMARMHGWRSRTFRDLIVHHHRRVGMHDGGVLRAFYNMGCREALIGYHPIFEVVRSVNRMRASPMVIGGVTHLAGYITTKCRREPIAAPPDYVAFLRTEQKQRIRALLRLKRPN